MKTLSKLAETLQQIACRMIGWQHMILRHCSEASKQRLRKYVSGISLIMVVWAFIGYSIADHYFNATLLSRIMVAGVFALLIILIERIVILSEKNIPLTASRVVLGIVMAVLGGTILDQIFLKNDLEQEVLNSREVTIKEIVKQRLDNYNTDIKHFSHLSDSLLTENNRLNAEISKNPTYVTTAVSSSRQVVGVNEDGTPKYANSQNVTRTATPNPYIKQVENHTTLIQQYQDQIAKLQQAKMDVEKNTHEEISHRPIGFLEDLRATYNVIGSHWTATVFYILLFVFFFMIEIIVLTIKVGEKSCDYDILVQNQQSLKINQMNRTTTNLVNS